MKRYSSQLVLSSSGTLQPRTVVQFDQTNTVTDVFNLDKGQVEPSHTVFLDGVLSAQILSLKMHLSDAVLKTNTIGYCYIDVSDFNTITFNINQRIPLIIDFGTENLISINSLLPTLASKFPQLSVDDLIVASTLNPAKVLGIRNVLDLGVKTRLYQWMGLNLPDRLIAPSAKVNIVF